MKLEVLQENLNRALAITTRILSTKPQMAILSNVLLTTQSGKLILTSTNSETTIVFPLGAKVETAGSFTVPGRTLAELVSGLSAEKIFLEVKEGSLVVSGGKFKARINGVPASEFPKLEEEIQTKNFSPWQVTKSQFLRAVDQVIFAAATDESRAVLTGVLFTFKGEGKVVLATADGFRLSVVEMARTDLKGQEGLSFLIPAKSLAEVTRILREEKETENLKIAFTSGEGQIVFEIGDTRIYSKLIAGKFPDFEKIIPSISEVRIVLTADELQKAVRLASIFARDSANIIKLKIEKSKVKISANAAQVGENESEIDVKIEKGKNEELTIAFNYRYLLDLLSVVGSAEISLDLTGPLAPGVFRLPSDPTFLHIIMPVRVQE